MLNGRSIPHLVQHRFEPLKISEVPYFPAFHAPLHLNPPALHVPVIWLVVSVVFLLIHLVPGDPIQQMLGEGAASADVQAARHAYGLDVPLPQQYVNYWRGVLRGDLGRSLRLPPNLSPASSCQRYPKTILLTVASMDRRFAHFNSRRPCAQPVAAIAGTTAGSVRRSRSGGCRAGPRNGSCQGSRHEASSVRSRPTSASAPTRAPRVASSASTPTRSRRASGDREDRRHRLGRARGPACR